MSLEPEYIAAIICAVIGYAVVSFLMRGSRSSDGEKKQDQSDTKSGTKILQWFEVLEVSPSASIDEIKLAYRKKISGYHPDRVASLAQELRELAEERSKAINEAYRIAMLLKN
jgi:DnaJ like chaperone protein